MSDYIQRIIAYLPSFISELLALVSGPKRFIHRLDLEDKKNLTRALVYAAIAYIIATVLLPSDFKQVEVFDANLLLQMGKYLVIILLMAIALYTAWRLVGGKAPIHHFVIIYCYYSGTQFLLIAIIIGTALKTLQIENEALYDRLVLLLNMPPSPEIQSEIARLGTDPACQQAKAIFAVGVVLILFWFVCFWGAYRELNGLSKGRSAIAFVLALLLMGVAGYIAGLLFI